EELDEKRCRVADRLLIEGVQHCVTRSVGSGTRTLRDAFAEMGCHAAKRALIDPSLLRTRERYAIGLQLYDRRRRFLAHEFDRVLVSEPVGALHRVVHVPAPVVLTHVAQRSTDATLGRDRVAARWKELGNAGRR